MKILLDTDPGTDDAIALLWLMALDARYKAEVLAVTSTAGNVRSEQTFVNATRLLRLCHRDDIEVGRGVLKSVTNAVRVHGADGLAGTGSLLPSPTVRISDARVSDRMIVELVNEYPDEITIVAIGPASNLAAAERLAPGTLACTERIVMLGGTVHPKHQDDRPEFNVFSDPAAWRVVLERASNVAVIPLDITRRITLSSAHVAAAGLNARTGKVGQFVKSLCEAMTHNARKNGVAGGFMVHDAAAIACCCYPDSLRLTPARLEVGVDSADRGRTTVARYGKSNALLAQSVRTDLLTKNLLNDLAHLAQRVQ